MFNNHEENMSAVQQPLYEDRAVSVTTRKTKRAKTKWIKQIRYIKNCTKSMYVSKNVISRVNNYINARSDTLTDNLLTVI